MWGVLMGTRRGETSTIQMMQTNRWMGHMSTPSANRGTTLNNRGREVDTGALRAPVRMQISRSPAALLISEGTHNHRGSRMRTPTALVSMQMGNLCKASNEH